MAPSSDVDKPSARHQNESHRGMPSTLEWCSTPPWKRMAGMPVPGKGSIGICSILFRSMGAGIIGNCHAKHHVVPPVMANNPSNAFVTRSTDLCKRLKDSFLWGDPTGKKMKNYGRETNSCLQRLVFSPCKRVCSVFRRRTGGNCQPLSPLLVKCIQHIQIVNQLMLQQRDMLSGKERGVIGPRRGKQ